MSIWQILVVLAAASIAAFRAGNPVFLWLLILIPLTFLFGFGLREAEKIRKVGYFKVKIGDETTAGNIMKDGDGNLYSVEVEPEE